VHRRVVIGPVFATLDDAENVHLDPETVPGGEGQLYVRVTDGVAHADALILEVVEHGDHDGREHEAADELIEGQDEPGLEIQPLSQAFGDCKDGHEVAATIEAAQQHEHCRSDGVHHSELHRGDVSVEVGGNVCLRHRVINHEANIIFILVGWNVILRLYYNHHFPFTSP